MAYCILTYEELYRFQCSCYISAENLLLNLSYCSDSAALPLNPAGDYPHTIYLRVLFRRMIGAFQGQKTRGKCVPDTAMHEFAGHKNI